MLLILLWVRSLRHTDRILDSSGGHCAYVMSHEGLFNVYWSADAGFEPEWRYDTWPRDPDFSIRTFVGNGRARWRSGFVYAEGYTVNGAPARQVYFPFWAVVVPLAAPPTVWLILHRRRRRRRAIGRCAGCGYDLRATPDRCPECGLLSRNELKSAPADVR